MMMRTKTLLGLMVMLVAAAIWGLSPSGALAAKGKGKSDKSVKSSESDDMNFEPEAIEKAGPPSKTLERALRLYDKGDFYSASIELFKVINKESKDTPGNRQRAEFFMGKTMFQQKFYAAAMTSFDRIVEQGGKHKYYGITLKWLAALSKVLPESSGILEKIGKYSREDLEDPALNKVRQELYYLLGRHFYMQGKTEQAIELFKAVDEASEFFLPAKYMQAVSHVREYKGQPAVEAFKAILVVAAEPELRKKYPPGEVAKYTELANLGMARVFYSTEQFDTAIKYFEKLPNSSGYWTESLFEAAWAYFRRAGSTSISPLGKALGNIHTLNAPYFEEEFFPESVKIKAVVYFNLCQYDRAREAVGEFEAGFVPLRDALTEVVKQHGDDNSAFYAFAKQINKGTSKLDKNVERLAATALQDRTLLKTFDFVDELDRELKQHEQADSSWKTTAIAADVLQELTVQESLAEAEAGRLARERLQRLLAEINENRREMRKVKIEILNAKAGQKAAELQGLEFKGEGREGGIGKVDDEHETWPFNGEYWRDELGFYRFRTTSICGKKKK